VTLGQRARNHRQAISLWRQRELRMLGDIALREHRPRRRDDGETNGACTLDWLPQREPRTADRDRGNNGSHSCPHRPARCRHRR
jgi:hypothetical protein